MIDTQISEEQIFAAIKEAQAALSARGIARYLDIDAPLETAQQIKETCRQLEAAGKLFSYRLASGARFYDLTRDGLELAKQAEAEQDNIDNPQPIDAEAELKAAALAVWQSVEEVNRGVWQVPHEAMCRMAKALQACGVEL